MFFVMGKFEINMDDDLMDKIQKTIDTGLDEVAEELEFEWRRLVATELHQSRDEYFKGMSVERVGTSVEMNLTGALATAVEGGSDRFDLKPGFLKGKTSANIPLFGNRPPAQDRFRRAPAKTAPWLHPGVKSMNLMSKAQEKVTDEVVDQVFERLLGKVVL